jgi:hypothetical protein
MAVPSSVLKEFVRKVYRASDEQDIPRDEYLDGLADVALEAMQKGKSISSSSGNGTTVNYELFYGWQPTSLLEVIAAARENIGLATAALAVAEIKPVRHYSTDFAGIYK